MGVSLMPRTLRQIRDELGWTREQLVVAANGQVSLRTISRIEHGESEPNRSVRKIIADALGTTVDEVAWPTKKEPKETKETKEP